MHTIKTSFEVDTLPRKVVRQLPILRAIGQAEFDRSHVLGGVERSEIQRVCDTSADCDAVLLTLPSHETVVLICGGALRQLHRVPRIVLV